MKLRIIHYPWASKPYCVQEYVSYGDSADWGDSDYFATEEAARKYVDLYLQGSQVIAEFTSAVEAPSAVPTVAA